MRRRITRDLVHELCASATPTDLAALVVAVGEHTALVFSAAPDPLGELNQLLHEGGRPVGIIRRFSVAGEACCVVEPIQECADEAWVRPYLQAVAESLFAEELESASMPASCG